MSALPAISASAVRLPAAANAAPAARPGTAVAGEILLACPVARGAVVLFGWHTARLPRQAQLVLERDGLSVHGPCRLHAWRRDAAGSAWFIAAVQLRAGHAVPPGAQVTIPLPGGDGIALGTLPAAACAPAAMAERLAEACGDQSGPSALFLADLAIAAPGSQPLRALLGAFLGAASEADGVIEIVGHADDTLMLQGWGRSAAAEATVALLAERKVSRHPVSVAGFARSDIAPPSEGLVCLVGACTHGDAAPPGTVWFVAGTALLRRSLLPGHRQLTAAETAGHLRDIMPLLRCEPETTAHVARLMRPCFNGHDTLSSLDRPVRAAVDLAAILPGVGLFVSGWLIDPEGQARSVSLAVAPGVRHRLDGRWSRLTRPDVADAFRSDPRFRSLDTERPDFGFAVFAPGMPAAAKRGDLHLAVEFDDTLAFLPVAQAHGGMRALLRRVFGSIDLNQPGSHPAIAAQLGPLLRQVLSAGLPLPAAELFRRSRTAPRRALLLALPPAGSPPHVALSFLLAEPLSRDEGLVLVAPACWSEHRLSALERALDLYGIDACLLRTSEPCEWTEALELAARATDADVLLCLGEGAAAGASGGWRHALAAQLDQLPQESIVFPTALYEDAAVRSIGVAAVEPLAAMPWLRLHRPAAGQPAAGVAAGPTELVAGSLAGALLRRRAWQAAGGFASGGMLAGAQELAFFARLAAAGGVIVHQPAISIFAPPGPPPAEPSGWRRVAALADGWVLAAARPSPGGA